MISATRLLQGLAILPLVATAAENQEGARAGTLAPCPIHETITAEFSQGGSRNEPRHASGTVSLYWSNGWWEAIVQYNDPASHHPRLESCMRIPDGVRRYTLFEGANAKSLPTAEAFPLACP